jgi:tetratricopeptide (TPR) repeat protein
MQFFRRSHPPDEAEQHYREALRYRDRKKRDFDLKLAIQHFKDAIRLEPNNPAYHCGLGRAYVATPLLAITRGVNAGFKLSKSAELAISELKEAIRLKPNYSEAFMILGEAYMYLGDKEKALQAFQTVVELPGSKALHSYAERESLQVEEGINTAPQPEEAKRHLEQAVAYRNQKKYRQAEKELDKALHVAPDWHWLYDNLCKMGG